MLGVARSGVYRKPRLINDNDLEPIDGKQARHLMRRIGIEVLGRSRNPANPRPAIRPISLSPARPFDRTAEPGLGRRYHVHSDRPRLFLSGRRYRRGEPSGSYLATVEHVGRFILRGSAGGGAGSRDDLLEGETSTRSLSPKS